jgi:hypothetical protein
LRIALPSGAEILSRGAQAPAGDMICVSGAPGAAGALVFAHDFTADPVRAARHLFEALACVLPCAKGKDSFRFFLPNGTTIWARSREVRIVKSAVPKFAWREAHWSRSRTHAESFLCALLAEIASAFPSNIRDLNSNEEGFADAYRARADVEKPLRFSNSSHA